MALVYTPVPRYELPNAEARFSRAFFQRYAKTYLRHLTQEDLRHLWQVEIVSQGLLYLASRLSALGHEVTYLACGNNPHMPPLDAPAAIAKRLARSSLAYDLVCFYDITCNHHTAEHLAALVKASNPDTIIGIGGPHAAAAAESVLLPAPERPSSNRQGMYSPFDFIGIGEGEETIADVANAISCGRHLQPMPGLALVQDGQVVLGPPRGRRNPVDFAIPAYELCEATALPAARIFPFRGCPNSCAFCADPWRKRVTHVALDRVSEEVDLLYSRLGTRYLYLGCEDFLWDTTRALELASLISSTHGDIRWTAQCRVKTGLRPDTLERLADCGCVGIEFGIESSSQQILDGINKNIRLSDAKECLQKAKQVGLLTHAYWMIGLPGETPETAAETQDTMISWAEDGLLDTWEYKTYIPYPGTPVFDDPKRYGVRILTNDFRQYHYALGPVIEPIAFPRDRLREMYLSGLERSAESMWGHCSEDSVNIGVDFSTIENMF